MNDLFEFEKFATVDVVDTYLVEQVSKLMEMANEQKENVSGSGKARQDNQQGTRFVDSPFKAEAEKEELAV